MRTDTRAPFLHVKHSLSFHFCDTVFYKVLGNVLSNPQTQFSSVADIHSHSHLGKELELPLPHQPVLRYLFVNKQTIG